GNTTIQVAAARLDQARAFVRASRAEQMPQGGVVAGARRVDGLPTSRAGSPSTLATAAAGISYEVDLFGRLAQATNAASLDAQSREALLQSTRLLIEAEVAQTYLSLRATDVERALVRGTVVAYQGTLTLTERRYRAGDVAELDVSRAKTEVAATESEAIALDRRRAELEHALAVLVGEVPSSLQLGETDRSKRTPVVPRAGP